MQNTESEAGAMGSAKTRHSALELDALVASVRIGTSSQTADLEKLSESVFGDRVRASYWDCAAALLFEGLVLHLLYQRRREGILMPLPPIKEIASGDLEALLTEMLRYEHLPTGPHPAIRRSALDQLNRPMDEAASVLSTLKMRLTRCCGAEG